MATSIASPAIFVATPTETTAPVSATILASPARIALASAQASSIDSRRAWLWSFLAILAVSQLYFFRELLAAFAIFTIAFAAVAFVVVSFCMLVKCGERAFARLSPVRQPVLQITRIPGDSHKLA
ncbi:MAG: hypothetical protein ACHQIK_14345 [Candidatus Acidiferrales bacterium]